MTAPMVAADARPTKNFFITNITRDLSLEDAILDLVDNSIDAFIRTREIDVSPALLHNGRASGLKRSSSDVSVAISDQKFTITDKCGGIDLEHARSTVFRFGRPEDAYDSTLGVYGIGLKRAMFKIGRDITIESRTETSGFRATLDVDSWSKSDTDWTIPLEEIPRAKNAGDAGTTISIQRLNSEVKLRINDGTLMRRLGDSLASTYSLFLDRLVKIELNGRMIVPRPLPIAVSDELQPARHTVEYNGVHAELFAGLATRVDGEWNAERAGWYVLCNGRVVVSADKTDLTGWGLSGPRFVSKHRGFVGIAFFFSKDPASLPWTTTKRGLNLESAAYQAARKEMSALGRPVLDFLNNMYPSEPAESIESRELVEKLKTVGVSTVLSSARPSFAPVVRRTRRKKTTVSIRFDAEQADVDRVRRRIGKPNWTPGNIGRHTFEYFLKVECAE